MTVLITRPFTAAKRTEQILQRTGISTWIDPVLTIIFLPTIIDPTAYDAIITTSVNGVESFAKLTRKRDMPIFCAGHASAAIAQELGFMHIFYPKIPGGKELVTLVKQFPFKHLAYIRGEIIKVDISDALTNVSDIHIDIYITYKTVPTSAWSNETLNLFYTKKISAITFYSEQSAHITLDLLKKHNLLDYTPSITAVCLSEAVADRVHEDIWKEIKILSS